MEKKKIRVAFLGFWHSHASTNPDIQFTGLGVYGTVKCHPDIEVIAGWDFDHTRGEKECRRLGIPYMEDLDELLCRNDIDGVVVMCETVKHKEICIKAADYGKHIYVNKVLAPTIKEANEIVKEVKKQKVVMITMLSRLYEKWCIKIRDLIKEDAIGKLISLRIWHAHGIVTDYYPTDGMGYLPDGHGFLQKEDGAGGCYVDMCHPQYMTPFFTGGMPRSIYSRMSSVTGRGNVEDNAVSILDYENGPYVILEEGWACGPVTTEVEVQGTNGTIIYRDDRSDTRYGCFAVRRGTEPEFKELELQQAEDTPLDEWIRCIRKNVMPEENMERALDLSRLNEAAYLSAKLKMPVEIKSLEGESYDTCNSLE